MRTGARLFLVLTLAVTVPSRANADSPTIGDSCAEVGSTATGRKPLTCADIGRNRFVWARITPSEVVKTKPTTSIAAPSKLGKTANETPSRKNARQKAKDYLDTSSFSRSGLIKQLEFEGFSKQDSTYGVDALTVDWNA